MREGRLMDEFDRASLAEERDRERALLAHRLRSAERAVPDFCAGCDAFPKQKDCSDYKDCLVDFTRRQAAAERNGRGG
jgi:hypothetical protein